MSITRPRAYLEQPGFLYDLCTLFVYAYNPEYMEWVHETSMEKPAAELAKTRKLIKQSGPYPPELRPFFHRSSSGGGGASLFSKKCYYPAVNDETYLCDRLLPVVLEQLKNTQRMVNDVFDYYLRDQTNTSGALAAVADFSLLAPILYKSKLDSAVKDSLWNFFASPRSVLNLLSEQLEEKEAWLRKYYGEHSDELEAAKAAVPWALVDALYENDDRHTESQVRYYTLCMMAKFTSLFHHGERHWIDLCGILVEYGLRQRTEPTTESVDFQSFCKALSEPTRMAVFNLLLENGSMTRSELCLKTGMSISGSQYHLEAMNDARLLRFTSKERETRWSLNKPCVMTVGRYVTELAESIKENKEEVK